MEIEGVRVRDGGRREENWGSEGEGWREERGELGE